jgi:undecaprenyl pyrophosphate phosphatase UppP
MTNANCDDLGFNASDAMAIAMALGTICLVVWQFRNGIALGRGGGAWKSNKSRRFACMMGCWTLLAMVFSVVAIFDVYARIHHLPRCR